MTADPGLASTAVCREVTLRLHSGGYVNVLAGDYESDIQVARSQTLHSVASALRYGHSGLREETADQAIRVLDHIHIPLLAYRNRVRIRQFS